MYKYPDSSMAPSAQSASLPLFLDISGKLSAAAAAALPPPPAQLTCGSLLVPPPARMAEQKEWVDGTADVLTAAASSPQVSRWDFTAAAGDFLPFNPIS